MELEFDHVGIDVETNGLDSNKSEILEVTATEYNLSGKFGETLTFLCRPISGVIPQETININGITWEMVKDKPTYLHDGIRETIAKFIGPRVLVGHNIDDFDIKFLKVRPSATVDTLKMVRKKYNTRAGNNLKAACIREGLEWDAKRAHRAEYDVEMCIKLHLRLVGKQKDVSLPLFERIAPAELPMNMRKLGVVPTDDDRRLLATQTYSYSRISLFHQCPFKWFMRYIKKIREKEQDYFMVGKMCHKIAEDSGQWCSRQTFINKFSVYGQEKNIAITQEMIDMIVGGGSRTPDEITMMDLGALLYDKPSLIAKFEIEKGLAFLSVKIDETVGANDYERPSMPDLETYNLIINSTVTFFRCTDPGIVSDVRYIMNKFFVSHDFSLLPGEIRTTERKLAFDKNWTMLSDFFDQSAFFRGIIDVLHYFPKTMIVEDYKSSRKMMTETELKNDIQTKIYGALAYKFMPEGSIDRIVLKMNYMRFGIVLEHEIVDPKALVAEVDRWISDSIQSIEAEMLKIDGTAFMPKRNEYCHKCELGEDGRCPLFNKNLVNEVSDPDNFLIRSVDDCRKAWKRVECNKAENKRLTGLCKQFMETHEGEVRIDEHAKLDFYVDESRDYDSSETMKWLLSKGVDITYAIKFFTISAANVEKLIQKKELEMNVGELETVSKAKRKSTFDAFTAEEARDKGFANAVMNPDPT